MLFCLPSYQLPQSKKKTSHKRTQLQITYIFVTNGGELANVTHIFVTNGGELPLKLHSHYHVLKPKGRATTPFGT